MPLLQVRDFPEELYSQLKIAAKAANRSLTQQTVVVMREYLSGKQTGESTADTKREAGKVRRREAFAAIERFNQENPGIFKDSADPVDLIRNDRDHDRFETMDLI